MVHPMPVLGRRSVRIPGETASILMITVDFLQKHEANAETTPQLGHWSSRYSD
jgi:hypothetical protein